MVVLAAAFVLSLALKLATVAIGGPQYMIDDFSLYEGGFLVWFGQAPPQHAFIECWVSGLCSLAVFAVKTVMGVAAVGAGGEDVITRALRDFYNAPDAYYAAYRSLLVAVDLATAVVVFKIARRVLAGTLWPAVWVTVLFLFTYNTLWAALVGRPDTLLTCAATLGMYLYLKGSDGTSPPMFWWAAICLGLAAGLKMHGALFTIFVMIDQLRIRGIRAGWRPATAFAALAFFFFLVADGSLLFDPLKYVKARWATYHDDFSPYIHWGDQFLVMLRSTGWLTVPLAIVGAVAALRQRLAPPALKTVATIALGWLVIFGVTRQLRGYWMLPALPLFYVLGASALARLSRTRLRLALALAITSVMVAQTAWLSWRTRHTDLNELRSWVLAHIAPDQPFYILGYSVLRLPKNTATMGMYKVAYEREAASDLHNGMPFVERHLKNWEESAALRLFDMLGYQNDGGYSFYGYYDFPPGKFGDLVPLDRMAFLIVQEEFPIDKVPGLRRLLADEYRLVAEPRSEGGDGRGLTHQLYRRIRP